MPSNMPCLRMFRACFAALASGSRSPRKERSAPLSKAETELILRRGAMFMGAEGCRARYYERETRGAKRSQAKPERSCGR